MKTRIALIGAKAEEWLKVSESLKKPKKSKGKKSKRRLLEIDLDELWKKIIYLTYNYTCEVCGKFFPPDPITGSSTGTQAHHIIGRGNFNVRWDPEDGSCLCGYDHKLSPNCPHRDKTGFLNWLSKHRREGLYEDLVKRAGESGGAKKRTILKLIELKEELIKIKENLQNEYNKIIRRN